MSSRVIRIGSLTACILFAAPSVALANAGLPMLAVVWPGMGIALLPIIALEAYLLSRPLSLSLRRTVLIAAVANGVSTIVGIPLAWGVMAAIQMFVPGGGGAGPDIGTIFGKLFAVTVQAPWLMPYDSEMQWMIPVASVVLLVPFFFASWGIEYLVARVMLRGADQQLLLRAMAKANLVSYALLGVVMPVVLAVMVSRSGI